MLANVLVSQAAGDARAGRRAAAGDRSELSRRDPGGRRAERDLDRHLPVQPRRAGGARSTTRSQRLQAIREALAGRATAPASPAWNDAAAGDRRRLLEAQLAGGALFELRASVPNRPGVIAELALELGRAGVNITDMALYPAGDMSEGVVALWIAGEDAGRAAPQRARPAGSGSRWRAR